MSFRQLPDQYAMNYFNYFTEIEEEFVKRRGSHLLVSPLDWSLIETWKQRGVPLHVVLRGINVSFDAYDQRASRGRKVNSLLYCQQEVEAMFLEYCESRVGLNNTDVASGKGGEMNGCGEDRSQFSSQRLIEYLTEHHEALEQLARAHSQETSLSETFARTA